MDGFFGPLFGDFFGSAFGLIAEDEENDYYIISVDELKTYLDIDDTADDEKLELIVAAATDYIESQCNRKIMSREYTEYYNGDGITDLFLNQYPIISEEDEIKVYFSTDAPRYFDEEISGDYIVIEPEVGIVSLLSSVFPKGKKTVKVVYEAGYEVAPHDIQRAAFELAALLWQKEQNKIDLISSYSITGTNITVQSDKAVNSFCQQVIKKYKRDFN